MTVSRVVNEDQQVTKETRARVQQSIEALHFLPNKLARGLARTKTGAFAVVVPDLANPFFTDILRGIEDVAWHSGYNVILFNTRGDLERESSCVRELLSSGVDGALIAPVGDRSKTHLRELSRARTPVVLIDREIPGFTADVVRGDSVGGAAILVQHLIDLGHTRIAMVTESDDVSTARERKQGYRLALEAAGIPFRDELVVVASAIDLNVARKSAENLLARAERPSAIFTVNNIIVMGVLEAARSLRLRVPENLSVACFDDIEHVERVYPFLTVMAQPAETFGTVATQLLLDRITQRIHDGSRTVVLPPTLIVRKSCAPYDGHIREARADRLTDTPT